MEKYDKIWEKIKDFFKKQFDSKAVYNVRLNKEILFK